MDRVPYMIQVCAVSHAAIVLVAIVLASENIEIGTKEDAIADDSFRLADNEDVSKTTNEKLNRMATMNVDFDQLSNAETDPTIKSECSRAMMSPSHFTEKLEFDSEKAA